MIFNVVGLSPWWDRPHDAFHTVVDLWQVLIPFSARWWESETIVASLLEGTPIFEWYMAKFVVKNEHWKDMCYDEIELCVKDVDIIKFLKKENLRIVSQTYLGYCFDLLECLHSLDKWYWFRVWEVKRLVGLKCLLTHPHSNNKKIPPSSTQIELTKLVTCE